MPEIKQDLRTATFIVAANDSVHKNMADYVCPGVNDHLTIQAALDALPATGGEVKLLEGTYNCEVQINLDSNQTLRGCGRNTILTTTTADLIFLSAVGVALTHLTGIVIADLQIDGGAGFVSDCGIYFKYVDYSLIQNVYSRRHTSGTGSYTTGIYLLNSDFNQIVNNTCVGNSVGISLDVSSNNTVTGNTCQGNGGDGILLYASSNNTVTGNTCVGNSVGISLYASSNNTVTGNTCQGNGGVGISLYASSNNTVTGNTCQGNDGYGIYLSASSNNNTVTGNTCQGNDSVGISLDVSSNNTVTGNTCQGNDSVGISLYASSNNTISGNTCTENSQVADDIYDNIYFVASSYNLILGNLCRAPTVGTTLTTGEIAGATDIHVTDTAGFEVGDGVVLDLGGAFEEYWRISAITAGAPGIITIPAPGLTNAQAAGETIDVPEARYGINISDAGSTENVVKENDLYDSGKTGNLNDAGTDTIVRGNRGYIASGEELVASGALTPGNANDFAFAWQNPHASAIVVTRVVIDETTAGGTAGALLDVGSAADATTHSDNLIDGMDLNTAGVYDNLDNPGVNGKSKQKVDANGGATDWVTGQILVQNAAALAGKYYIYFTGV